VNFWDLHNKQEECCGEMSTPARRRLIRDFKKLQQVGCFFFLLF